jgi:hypothetical protein
VSTASTPVGVSSGSTAGAGGAAPLPVVAE